MKTLLVIGITLFISFSCMPSHSTLKFPEGKKEVEIPFTVFHGWIVIKAMVNGTEELSFILDTGAPIAILASENLAARLNLTMSGEMKVKGGDGHEARSVPLASHVKFKIGEIEIEDGLMAIGLGGNVFAGVDGVLGKYLFDHAVVRIRWNERKIVITRPDQFSYNGQGTILPLRLTEASHVYTEVKVNNEGHESILNTIVDLGQKSSFVIDGEARKLLGIGKAKITNTRIGRGVNGAFFGDVTKTDISLGSLSLTGVTTFIRNGTEDIEPDFHAKIGSGALNRFDMILDFGRQQMILEKNESYSAPFTYNQSGIILEPFLPEAVVKTGDLIHLSKTALVTIENIIPASPASENGLTAGDHVLSVNGQWVGEIALDTLDNLISGIGADSIELQIQRGKEVLNKKLKTKSLL